MYKIWNYVFVHSTNYFDITLSGVGLRAVEARFSETWAIPTYSFPKAPLHCNDTKRKYM